MLHFFPPGLAERYLLFTFVATLGVLQLMAAHYHWAGLSLVGRQRWRWGYVLGASLLGGAYLWFFWAVQPLIFQPGLAGAELSTLFAISTLLAVAATLALASVLHRKTVGVESKGEPMNLHPGQCTLRRQADAGPWPAAIVVSDLPDGDFSVSRLVDHLVDQGFLTLSIDLANDGPVEYPEVLARLPAACAYLRGRSDADGRGIVVIATGIGGDLALRAAAIDLTIQGVAAIDPLLDPEATGLDLLRRSTFWEVFRWGGVRRRLVEALTAANRLPQLENRPALLVYRTNPTSLGEVATGDVQVAVVHTDDEAVQRVVGWAAEVIGRREHVA